MTARTSNEIEVLLKDIMEGYIKGNHTVWDALYMMEAVLRNTKVKQEG